LGTWGHALLDLLGPAEFPESLAAGVDLEIASKKTAGSWVTGSELSAIF